MRLLPDDRAAIADVAARWKAQYCHADGSWGTTLLGDTGVIYARLAALGSDATAADVAHIIGNTSWIGESCNECGDGRAIVLIGEEPDYESSTVYLCAACVERVTRLIAPPASVDAEDRNRSENPS